MTLVAQFVNLAGFYYVLGISYELDFITNIETWRKPSIWS